MTPARPYPRLHPTVIGREHHRRRGRDLHVAVLLAVDEQRCRPALTEPAAVVFELDADLVLAGRDSGLALGIEVVDAEQVVAVLESTGLAVEAPAADVGALRDDDPFAPPAGTSISAVTECDLFLRLSTAFSDRRLMPGKRICVVALDQDRPSGEIGIHALGNAIVEREDVVARRLNQPQPLQLVQLLRHLLRQIVRLAPVLGRVVQLPDIVVERGVFSPTSSHGVLCRVTAVHPL